MSPQEGRARGALIGLAIGDALGMPTQYLPRQIIRSRWGVLDGFVDAPPDNDISAGMTAGQVTDDTDQAVIIGRLLVDGEGTVDPTALADALTTWEDRMRAAGSHDLLGPSTIRALQQVAAGASTDDTGRWGDTNGAAMRIAPVGIVYSTADLPRLVDAVEQASHVTHNTGIAIAGASAVAAAVSSGIDGAPWHDSLSTAVEAVALGSVRGAYVAGADVAARIRWAIDLTHDLEASEMLEVTYRLVGAGVATQESVPAAFALASYFHETPWDACRYAASLGGDSDTIAAIAGAMLGAHHGVDAFPMDVVAQLGAANPTLHLPVLADRLLALRTVQPAHA